MKSILLSCLAAVKRHVRHNYSFPSTARWFHYSYPPSLHRVPSLYRDRIDPYSGTLSDGGHTSGLHSRTRESEIKTRPVDPNTQQLRLPRGGSFQVVHVTVLFRSPLLPSCLALLDLMGHQHSDTRRPRYRVKQRGTLTRQALKSPLARDGLAKPSSTFLPSSPLP